MRPRRADKRVDPRRWKGRRAPGRGGREGRDYHPLRQRRTKKRPFQGGRENRDAAGRRTLRCPPHPAPAAIKNSRRRRERRLPCESRGALDPSSSCLHPSRERGDSPVDSMERNWKIFGAVLGFAQRVGLGNIETTFNISLLIHVWFESSWHICSLNSCNRDAGQLQ